MPKQAKFRLTVSPPELIEMMQPELDFWAQTYPELDLAVEAMKCCEYWNVQRGGFINPRLAYMNWLGKAEQMRKDDERRNGHKPMGDNHSGPLTFKGETDRQGFLQDYERRRGVSYLAEGGT